MSGIWVCATDQGLILGFRNPEQASVFKLLFIFFFQFKVLFDLLDFITTSILINRKQIET